MTVLSTTMASISGSTSEWDLNAVLMACGTVAVASAMYYLLAPLLSRSRKIGDIDFQDQSGLFEGPELIRYSRLNKDGRDGKFVRTLYEDCTTLYEAFRRGAKVSNDGPCLGWRDGVNAPYQWMTYNEALLRAHNFGAGLLHLEVFNLADRCKIVELENVFLPSLHLTGLQGGSKTNVGIYAQNCPEWVLTEQALYQYSMVVVPLYDTLGADACRYIIEQSELKPNMSTIVCDSDAKLNFLLDKSPRCLQQVILIKEPALELSKRAKAKGLAILKFEDVEKMGAAHITPTQPPTSTDLATICYTSGTTGCPKGVMLNHGNIIACVSSVLIQLGNEKPRAEDVMISYLPLAHMLERCCQCGMYMAGGSVGFFRGDIRTLGADMKALGPTVCPTVPRLLNRLYDKVHGAAQGNFIKRTILNVAFRRKLAELQRGVVRRNSIWDALIFRPVQEGMGGRLRLMVVGSAPLAGHVLTFARAALGCVIVEGYGQTECVAPATLTLQGDSVPEHVGPPLPCCQIKLVDVPDMQYYASAGHGEICIRGSSVFQGYYLDPEKTAQTVDSQGWLHTGDIGTWQPNGTLKIIDRKKHIFKLSQGEYIAPEKIENIYLGSRFVHQVFVTGDSLKSSVVAIVVPEEETVQELATIHGIEGTFSSLCGNQQIKEVILQDIAALGQSAGLKSFEQVKEIYLHPTPFSVENGLLTPTLKTKRVELKHYFSPQIEDMYRSLPP
ncbi:unnamed protein product [Cyprideis torosa]|uniref:Long-chain-fatty-acid--CoA ligase n=1 Tax=Cyprideis torosa TaxID=163714 RepID=A0A7R8ZLM2_9CRUS|nr:unnamed protein product [Cyprideis torosa]CAG0882553.1 unnamed protein product [Cyprideis torosa]